MKTPADHNRALRQKRKDAGITEVRVWLLPEEVESLDRMIATLGAGCGFGSRTEGLIQTLRSSEGMGMRKWS